MKIKVRDDSQFAVFVSILVLSGLLLVSSIFLFNYSKRIKIDEENKVLLTYYSLSDEIKEFKNSNVKLMSGISAYLQVNEDVSDEDMYHFLDLLLKDQLDDIHHVGVLVDTRVKWVYPLQGNEAVLNVDLATLEEQREGVLYVKNTLETIFIGPVNLVQGEQMFIVRVPIVKENEYYGMVSIILKADRAFNFVEKHSQTYAMDYLITSPDNVDEIIYGDKSILALNPIKYRTDEAIGGWDIYIVPKGGWGYQLNHFSINIYLCVLASLIISWRVYAWLKRYNEVLVDNVKLESKYILDRFTNIYTREYFNIRVKEEVYEHANSHRSMSMIYFDLDHFKEVNDDYGHSSGDEVLIEVVKQIKAILKPNYVFSRWGGDEFIILLPDTDLKDASNFGETIRQIVKTNSICKAFGVTASVGVSQWVDNEYVESWFIRTDKALYAAKNSGRNKVSLSDHENEKNILTKIEWEKYSNSGNNTIDSEHRSILERCNLIVESALEQSSFDETIRNVEIVIQEMEAHFNDEIEILKAANYPYVENHQRIHDNLLAKTNEIFQKTIQRDITAVEFFSFLLLTVVEGHFKNEDVKYFPYLDGKTHH